MISPTAPVAPTTATLGATPETLSSLETREDCTPPDHQEEPQPNRHDTAGAARQQVLALANRGVRQTIQAIRMPRSLQQAVPFRAPLSPLWEEAGTGLPK
jgi:hypothetical protein